MATKAEYLKRYYSTKPSKKKKKKTKSTVHDHDHEWDPKNLEDVKRRWDVDAADGEL